MATRIGLLITIGGIALTLTMPPATALSGNTDVHIASLPQAVRKGQTAELVIDTTGATSEVSVAIHSALTREQYQRGDLVSVAVQDVFSLVPDSNELRLSIAPSRSTDLDDEIDLVANLDPGLHQLSVIVDGEVVDRAHILIQPDVTERSIPLSVAVVLQLSTKPVLQPDGSVIISATDRRALETLASVLELVPDAQISVELQPDIIEALSRSDETEDQALLGRLRAALEAKSLLSTALVDIDEQSFATASMGLFAGALNTRGDTILAAALGISPNRTVAILDDTAAGDAIDLLRDLGVGHVVVAEDRLRPLDPDDFATTLTQRFRMSGSEISTIDAAQTDERLAEELIDGLRSDQFFEELLLLAMDAPALARGVILPVSWTGDLDAVDLSTALAGIIANSDLDLVDLPTYFGHVSEARDAIEPLVRTHSSAPAPDFRGYAEALGGVSRLVDAYESMVGPEHPAVSGFRERLDTSAARVLTSNERATYLDQVETTVRQSSAVVRLQDDVSFRLTSRQATIPFVIENLGTEAVQVVVSLSSDNRIDFPAGPDVALLLQPGRNPIDIRVHARSSGTSLVDVDVRSPDGTLDLATGSIRITSTALSGVGVVIAVVALLVLLVWWLRQFAANRHSTKVRDDTADDELDSETSG